MKDGQMYTNIPSDDFDSGADFQISAEQGSSSNPNQPQDEFAGPKDNPTGPYSREFTEFTKVTQYKEVNRYIKVNQYFEGPFPHAP